MLPRPSAPITFEAPVEIHAAAGTPAQRRFTVDAYSGGELKVKPYSLPVVVDLASLQPDTSVVANLDHDHARRVGHVTEQTNDGRTLRLAGIVSAASEAAEEFTKSADQKFPWRASIEAMPGRLEPLARGQRATVNGRTFEGPILIARNSTLHGVAFLSKGADPNTRVVLATKGKTIMEPGKEELLETIRAEERTRVEKIEAAFTNLYIADQDLAERVQGVKLRAIHGEISLEEAQGSALRMCAATRALQKHRDEMPRGPQIRASRMDVQADVIEAALCMSSGLPNIEARFSEETLEAAHKAFRGRLGLQQVLIMAAVQNGYHYSAGERVTAGNLRGLLQHAFPPALMVQAGSTMSLPGILSNVGNKTVLAGWEEEDQAWREVADRKPVSDFKEATSYRLLDNMEYEEVSANGKLAHGQLGEESYTRKAKTYGKFWSLTRVDFINDDAGAFNDLRVRLGRGAGKKFNRLFWGKWLDNAAFFTTGRGNYLTGATSTLLSDGVGLQLGVTKFRKLQSADGKRVSGKPSILLHPPEVEFAARRLYQSTNVNAGGNNTADNNPDANIHAGLYKPVTADYLSDSTLTGYSDKEWYLLRDPRIAAAVCVSFLNGMETPTVESADAAFDTLGVDFRGYHDFGVDFAEWLAGIKSKAAA